MKRIFRVTALLAVLAVMLSSAMVANASTFVIQPGETAIITIEYSGARAVEGSLLLSDPQIVEMVEYEYTMDGLAQGEKFFLFSKNPAGESGKVVVKVTLKPDAPRGSSCIVSVSYAITAANSLLPGDTQTVMHTVSVAPKPPVNLSGLQTQLLRVQGLKQWDYTKESWAAVEEAGMVAAYNLSSTDQASVDNAEKQLKDAIDKLVPMNYTALQNALEQAAKGENLGEVSESWTQFVTDLTNACQQYTSGDQEASDAAAQQLLQSKDALATLLADIISQRTELEKELQETNDRYASFDAILAEKDALIATLTEKVETLEASVADKDKALVDKDDTIATLEEEVTKLQARIDTLQSLLDGSGSAGEEYNKLLEELEALEAEMKALRQQLKDTQKELDKVNGELEDVKTDLEDKKLELENALAQLESTRTELEDTKVSLKAEIDSANAELKKTQEALDKAVVQIETITAERDELASELETLRETWRKAQEELEIIKRERNEAMVNVSQAQADRQQILQQLEEAKKKQSQTKTELDSALEKLKQALTDLENAPEDQTEAVQALKDAMANLETAIAQREEALKEQEELRQQLDATQEELEKALEDLKVALDKETESIIVEVEVEPSYTFCNNPYHTIILILLIISLVLNAFLITLITIYLVKKRRTQLDDMPLVEYDIEDDAAQVNEDMLE